MIDPELLDTFLGLARTGSFSATAREQRLRQSTVSQRIKRLESLVGRRLLDRDTHRVTLTVEGQVMLDHARRVLDAHESLGRYLTGAPLRGRLRIGASEDFVLSALPDVLAEFVRRYPEVNLELTAGLSETLYDAFDAGVLDVVLVKRRRDDPRGTVAWREEIAWIGRPDYRLQQGDAVPLLLYPPPSVTRGLAIEALEIARRPWRIAFTSASLSGLTAAARAGVGVIPHSPRLTPPGLVVIDSAGDMLPSLPAIEFAVIGPGGHNPIARTLMSAILQWAASGRISKS
jgi:DNA-binding transcriptional LysR family regulator